MTAPTTPHTWADGYGVWHARAATKWQARAAILEELRARGPRDGIAEHRMRVVPVEGEDHHWVEHWVEDVPGWTPVAPLPGGNDDVWRCTALHCGALVRDSGEQGAREAHDLAFHTNYLGEPVLDADEPEPDPGDAEREAYNREAEEQMLGRPLFPNEH